MDGPPPAAVAVDEDGHVVSEGTHYGLDLAGSSSLPDHVVASARAKASNTINSRFFCFPIKTVQNLQTGFVLE